MVAQRCLIYISSFSAPSNDFVALPGLETVSRVRGDDLKVSEVSEKRWSSHTLPPAPEIKFDSSACCPAHLRAAFFSSSSGSSFFRTRARVGAIY